jgi:peptidoglycan/LPS O-acetylase OafA/YrhL
MSTSERDRLLELDVLRGLAALAVVLFHYTTRYTLLYGYHSVPDFAVPFGYLGVLFFFCISGFVIFMTLDKTRRAADFIVSRVSRLWPAYIAAMLITYCAVHVFGLPGRATTAEQALINVTMFQDLLHVPDVDEAYWSLQVELIFYGWMLLAFLAGALVHIRALLGVALVPPIVYFLAHRYFHHDLPYTAGVFLLVDYIPFFAIGIAAYNIRAGRGRAWWDLLLMAAALAAIFTCQTPPEFWVAVIAVIIFLAVAWRRLTWIAAGPLTFLGTISYTLYLIHQNVGYIVIRAATAHGVSPDSAICLALGVAIGLASVLTWTVEKPARSWLRHAYNRYFSHPTNNIAHPA